MSRRCCSNTLYINTLFLIFADFLNHRQTLNVLIFFVFSKFDLKLPHACLTLHWTPTENQANGGCVLQRENFLDYHFLVQDTRKNYIQKSILQKSYPTHVLTFSRRHCLDFVLLQLILFDPISAKNCYYYNRS